MTIFSESPAWLDGDKIDEVLFCEELCAEYPMICIHDCFFTVDGKVTDESWIKNAIFEKLKPHVRHGLSRKITSLLDTLRLLLLPAPADLSRPHPCGKRYAVPGRSLRGYQGLLPEPVARCL